MATVDLELPLQRTAAERAAMLVMMLVSIGEMLMGMIILAVPREMGLLLLDGALDPRGILVARMLGVAILALGVTWWMTRGDANRLSRYSAGFIVYNLGVGVLFGWAALAADQPALPWVVCVVHLTAGVAFAALVRRNRT